MSWTLIDSARGFDSVTLPDTTGANLLIAHFGTGAIVDTTPDNMGNTWSLLTQHVISTTNRSRIMYCLNPTVGASHTFTDPNAAVSESDIHFYAFQASGTPSYAGVENGANDATFAGTNTAPGGHSGSLSVTPPSDDALIFAAVTRNYVAATLNTGSVDSGFTIGETLSASSGAACISAYLNQATAAAVNPKFTWTGSARWVASVAVFSNTSGDATANGQTQTATASLIAGSATAGGSGSASGATLTATASVVSGAASAIRNGTAPAATLTATAGLIAGTASVAGVLNFQGTGMEFGARTGLLNSTFALENGKSYRYSVHELGSTIGAALLQSGLITLDSAGKLPNVSSELLVVGTTYRVIAIRELDGEAAIFQMIAI